MQQDLGMSSVVEPCNRLSTAYGLAGIFQGLLDGMDGRV